MKKKSIVTMRMEFMEAGEKIGFPRVPFGPGRRVKSGEPAWMAFAESAPLRNLAPALRNAHILAQYHAEAPPTPASDDVKARRIAGLAKARAAKAAKKAEVAV